MLCNKATGRSGALFPRILNAGQDDFLEFLPSEAETMMDDEGTKVTGSADFIGGSQSRTSI